MSIKTDVLNFLQNNISNYLSGQKLSEELKVSRAAVCKAVGQLRREGYVIEAVTNKGYRMAADGEPVNAETLRLALPAKLRNITITAFAKTDSTNTQARLLPADVKLPALIFANQQTSGRGRLGRDFHSPENGIYMTLAIRPVFSIERSTLVTVAAAVAVAKAIEECTNQTATIKWVNDVYVDNLKVCGILTEAMSDFEMGQIERLIIGIGINTSTAGFPDELKNIAGSISLDISPETSGTKKTANAKAILTALIVEYLLSYMEELSLPGTPSFVKTYREKSNLIGRDIFVYKGTYRSDPTVELGGIAARVTGIDDNGGLQVVYENGDCETLTNGEVSIRSASE